MPSNVKYYEAKTFIPLHAELGEGPFYEKNNHVLRLVDIFKRKIHFVDLHRGPQNGLKTIDVPDCICVTADIEGDKDHIICGAKYGFALFDRKTGKLDYVAKVYEEDAEKARRMRFNDGCIDPQGRFIAGTMNDPKVLSPPTPEGSLFRLDPDMSLHTLIPTGLSIPNGMGFNFAFTKFFLTDSATHTIFVYDYDNVNGEINFSSKKPFFKVPSKWGEDAVPDGFAMDVEECFWISIWGAGKVVRVNQQAEILAEVKIPTRCCTCPAFAGTTLYVTSATEEKSDECPKSHTNEGNVFYIDVGVEGAERDKFQVAC